MAKNTYRARVTLKMELLVQSDSIETASADTKRVVLERQGIRPEHIEHMTLAPVLGPDLLTATNLIAWQESEAIQRGTASQQARYSAGTLPEQELLDIARAELFRPLALFAKRTPMGFAGISHPRAKGLWQCLTVPRASGPVKDPSELVTWGTLPSPDLTESEHDTLKAVNDRAQEITRHAWMTRGQEIARVEARRMYNPMPEVVGVAPREHWGVCKVCGQKASQRSVLVSVYWAGRTLSREYLL